VYLPAVTGGLARGQAAVGWYEARGPDQRARGAEWHYRSAVTYDGGQHALGTAVTPEPGHFGGLGVGGDGECSDPDCNRDLLDFTTAATDPRTGCVGFAVPADPYNAPSSPSAPGRSSALLARQVAGPCLMPGAAPDRPVSSEDVLDRTAPMVRLRVSRTTASALARSGRLGMTIGVDEAAAVVITARLGSRIAARTRVSLREAGMRRLTVALDGAVRRRLRRGRRLVVLAGATDAAGNRRAASVKVRLR
jgi:hypothetical protein